MEKGIKIVDLVPGGNAERSGVLVGDVLLAINDKEVNSLDDFVNAIKDRGHSQVITVYRDGLTLKIEMALGKSPSPMSN